MSELRLFVIGGRDAGRTFVLDARRETVLGRDAQCDVRLADKSISRRHARLAFVDGAWELTDLGSRNGIRRASARIEHTLIEDGDEVTLGEVPVRFRATQVDASRGGTLEAAEPRAFGAQDSEGFEPEEIELEEIELEDVDPRPVAASSPDPVATSLAMEPAPDGSHDRTQGQAIGAPPRARATSTGWSRADLSQLPFWTQALVALLLLALFVAVVLLAFRGVQWLRV